MDRKQFLIREYVNKTIEASAVLSANKALVEQRLASFFTKPASVNKCRKAWLAAVADLPPSSSPEFNYKLLELRLARLLLDISLKMVQKLDGAD